jgi:hypothetical protein
MTQRSTQYKAGQSPPGLEDDGSFRDQCGNLVFSIVDVDGDILVVDRMTGLLVEYDDDEE